MKRYLKKLFLGISILLIFCVSVLFNTRKVESQKVELYGSDALAVIKHEKAYNVWCRYWPSVEGCCDHDWRDCTNQNFCEVGDCD